MTRVYPQDAKPWLSEENEENNAAYPCKITMILRMSHTSMPESLVKPAPYNSPSKGSMNITAGLQRALESKKVYERYSFSDSVSWVYICATKDRPDYLSRAARQNA